MPRCAVLPYIYGLGVNAPDYILKDGVRYRLVKDHLGTPRLVVNSTTGEVVKRLDLDEFGNITAETGTFDIPFGFAGGIRDTDTGLTKFGARWYDPETGRWLEKEPLGFGGSNNFYSYCDGDPVNWVDWNGLFRFDPSVPADVQKAIKSIQWDKKKIDAYRKLTGITASQFYEAIKNGSGPLIRVANLDDPHAVAECKKNPGDVITLDSDHLDEYFGDPSLSQLFIDDIVGHELAHYFNWMTGIGDNSYKFNDIGHQWEREALGSTGNWPLDKPFYITP